MAEEIRENLERLRMMGINEMVIKSLLTPKLELSKVLITSDLRIFLKDYNNREIRMGPLPKTVFLLFLRHPEGIIFKNISDYYKEILAIYIKVSGREIDQNMRQSLEQLTNPCCNTLNENCSRIRRAFLLEMDDELAKNYYITGERATCKKICLPRYLVSYVYPCPLNDIPETEIPIPF